MRSDCWGGFRALLGLLGLVFLLSFVSFVSAASNNDDYLHASGSTLFDASGNEVRLTGISWFGFETDQQVFHGIWSVKMETVLDTVANRGFNVLRVPVSVQLVNQWRSGKGGTPGSVNFGANPGLQGMTSLQVLDTAVAYAKRIGLKVMLDMHRVVNTQQVEGWTTNGYTVADFDAGWRWLAEHYKNDDTVIAVDLFNEPHGGPGNAAAIKWDTSSDANNWRDEAIRVANQILDINPNLLIVVEGVEATPKDGYTYDETNAANYHFSWWGGNLRRVKAIPVDLGSRQSQLVYSPHDYGPGVYAQPWLHAGFTEATLTAEYWDPSWLYIAKQNIAPLLVGEWGGKLDGGDNQRWMGYLAHTLVANRLSHTFWCVNPNSGDTGGILLDDWTSVDGAKYDIVKPTLWQDANGRFIGLNHEVNLGTNGTHVGTGGVANSSISPASSSFDKNTAKQADIVITLTPNGNTLSGIRNGSVALVAGTDFVTSGNTVTLRKSYLGTRSTGTTLLTFDFSAGTDPVLSVTVTDSTSSGVAVTGVTLSPTQLALSGATTGQLVAAIVPSNATNYTVGWISSNTAVATVDASGRVTAVADGTATIAATVTSQSGRVTAAATVTVSGIGSAIPAGCAGAAAVSLPLVINGVGDFCRVTSGTISNVNSWNTARIEINGVAYTNRWSSSMPARINGNYYIRYVGQYAWSHLEVAGSGGGAAPNYALTIAVSGSGSTSLAAGVHTYTMGTAVSVTATPASGSTFTGWSGAATGTANPVTVTMDGNKTLTANFASSGGALPSQCTGTCNAATPVPPTLSANGGLGNVTMYSTGASAGGACNYGSTNVKYYAAINVNVQSGDGQGQWQSGRACGQCAEVTALTSQGPRTVVVRIMDKCPDGNCGIDLGGLAPAAVMLDGAGRYTGQWRFVACDGHPEVSDGSPTLDVVSGSNAWWSRVRVRNPLAGVVGIDWKDTGSSASGSFPFASDPENAYEVPVSNVLRSGKTAVTVTVRYFDGRAATTTLTPAQLGSSGASYPLN